MIRIHFAFFFKHAKKYLASALSVRIFSSVMEFLHSRFHLTPHERVRITLNSQANVRLMDDNNFHQFKRGGQHRYYGGHAKESPVVLGPPHSGFWNVVVDLGGYSGSVRASVAKI